MEKLLQVTRVETLHSDKANCDFKKITFSAIKLMGNREVKIFGGGVRNLWPEHEVTLSTGEKTIIKADKYYDGIFVGDLFEGEVKRFDTTPYSLDKSGRMINQWTGVVFSTENPLVVAAKNLRQNNAVPIDPETGEKFQLIGQPAPTNKTLVGTDAQP